MSPAQKERNDATGDGEADGTTDPVKVEDTTQKNVPHDDIKTKLATNEKQGDMFTIGQILQYVNQVGGVGGPVAFKLLLNKWTPGWWS